ncbi:hypothetical protein LWI28_026229 [Acer negundo]|uniref:Uncharacterized protein n=1 Tax=Acer negundo TaxID=4023 RepID=A0AAD5ISK7_ACENE|nr:hypothetical protein LWI28_026229 [Acer negundo]
MDPYPVHTTPPVEEEDQWGEKGLFSLVPLHQGIDGEWSDGSGVIVCTSGMRRVRCRILGELIGRRDGVAALSMTRKRRCIDDGNGFTLY